MSAVSLRWHAVREAARMLRRRWALFVLGVALCGGALTLPLLAAIVGYGLMPLLAKAPIGPEISVFVALTASRQDIEGLKARVEKLNGVNDVRWVSRDDALADLARRSGVAPLTELKLNPLPDTLIVGLAPGAAPALLESSAATLRQLPKVDGVYADSRWYRRAIGSMQVAWRAALALGALALGVLVLIVVGAVRMLTATTSDELRLYRLVGADTGQIARPYAYAGAVLAATAAALAIAAAWVMLLAFEADLRWLGEVFSAPLWPRFPPWPCLLVGVVAAAFAGGSIGSLTVRAALRRQV